MCSLFCAKKNNVSFRFGEMRSTDAKQSAKEGQGQGVGCWVLGSGFWVAFIFGVGGGWCWGWSTVYGYYCCDWCLRHIYVSLCTGRNTERIEKKRGPSPESPFLVSAHHTHPSHTHTCTHPPPCRKQMKPKTQNAKSEKAPN